LEGSPVKKKIKKFLEWIGVHLQLNPKFYILAAIAGVASLALFTGLFFYSTSPSFCNSCHIMKPYYEAWKISKHNQVACVTCHMPPQTQAAMWAKFQSINHVVQLVTKKYTSKPYAQIEDASCLRSGCHATNILQGKVTFKKGIRFDHKFHLGDLRRGKQLRCTSCHSQIVVGTHLEVTESTCYLCHFKSSAAPVISLPLGNCTTCHEVPQKDIQFQGFNFNHIDFVKTGKGVHNPFYASELIQVADRNLDQFFRVIGQSSPGLPSQSPIKGGYCAQLCHAKAGVRVPKEISWKGEKLPHARHAFDFGLGCTSCHSAEKHKEVRVSSKDCMACHHSPDNTQCSRCHQNPTALYSAQNLPVDVPKAKASVKAGKVECVNCHDLSRKQTLENISSACTQCHDQAYADLLKGLREEVREAQKKTKDLLDQTSRKLTAAGKLNRDIGQAGILFEQGRKAYEFVAKAKGAHNVDLAGMILEQAQRDARKAEELLTSPGESVGKKSGFKG